MPELEIYLKIIFLYTFSIVSNSITKNKDPTYMTTYTRISNFHRPTLVCYTQNKSHVTRGHVYGVTMELNSSIEKNIGSTYKYSNFVISASMFKGYLL